MTISFREFRLCESFRNFVGDKSIPERRKWSSRAYSMLQKAYASIGGIKGSGFTSEEDMIQNIPFWKLYTRGDTIKVSIFYKDKDGRKIVAVATDGSRESKKILSSILKADFKVSWGEVSKALLTFILSNIPLTMIREVLLTPNQVQQIMKDKEILSVTDELLSQVGDFDRKIYMRYKKTLGEYFYIREIGGSLFIKLSIGKPNQFIK